MIRGFSLLTMGVLFFCLVLSVSPSSAEEPSPLLFSLFKSFISTIDGKRCDHVPSCARYAKNAVEAHGPVVGTILTCDRLMRCGGDDMEILSKVVVDGSLYVWDPVTENDFWWNKKEEAKKDPRNAPDFLHFTDWK
ncbi:MAG: membrane protein insertion efficiency factor YidD [Desulfobacterales bacterium]|nr:membrane protein insertion efficiency factor YidD [Desulfobacterales bacterium]